jgi:hypothetical protein
MNWGKTLGYGVLIWLIIFVVVWALMAGGWYNSQVMKGIVAIVAGILAYWFAMRLGSADWSKAIGLAAVWVVEAWILDWLITSRFNAGITGSKAVWLGYALIAVGAIVGSVWGKKGMSAMPM